MAVQYRFKSLSPSRREIRHTAQIYLDKRQDFMKINSSSSLDLSKSPQRRVSPFAPVRQPEADSFILKGIQQVDQLQDYQKLVRV
jgi:hypothetical protein